MSVYSIIAWGSIFCAFGAVCFGFIDDDKLFVILGATLICVSMLANITDILEEKKV
jgi:hypothetical protein